MNRERAIELVNQLYAELGESMQRLEAGQLPPAIAGACLLDLGVKLLAAGQLGEADIVTVFGRVLESEPGFSQDEVDAILEAAPFTCPKCGAPIETDGDLRVHFCERDTLPPEAPATERPCCPECGSRASIGPDGALACCNCNHYDEGGHA